MGNSVVEGRKAVVQRYVDILTDAGLKAVFGDQRNKDVLIDLLNVMLPPHRMVADISYETTEIPITVLSSGQFLQKVCPVCIEGLRYGVAEG